MLLIGIKGLSMKWAGVIMWSLGLGFETRSEIKMKTFSWYNVLKPKMIGADFLAKCDL